MIEGKIQRFIRKIKNNLTKKDIGGFTQQGHHLENFMAQPNDTNLKKSSSVDDLPLRPIISNIGTASYQLAKYLVKLLSPLSKSQSLHKK